MRTLYNIFKCTGILIIFISRAGRASVLVSSSQLTGFSVRWDTINCSGRVFNHRFSGSGHALVQLTVYNSLSTSRDEWFSIKVWLIHDCSFYLMLQNKKCYIGTNEQSVFFLSKSNPINWNFRLPNWDIPGFGTRPSLLCVYFKFWVCYILLWYLLLWYLAAMIVNCYILLLLFIFTFT